MPYQMNETGLDAGVADFAQDQFDRNQEYQDQKRQLDMANTYWEAMKRQQETQMLIERQKNMKDIGEAVVPGMVKKSVRQNGDGTLSVEWGLPQADAKDFQPITFGDTSAGSFDKTTGSYYDAQGNPVTDASRYTRQPSGPAPHYTTDAQGNQLSITGNVATPIKMPDGTPVMGKSLVDPDAVAQQRLAQQSAMADVRDALRNGTPQEQADARASLRLMAQTGRTGLITTTPADIGTDPGRDRFFLNPMRAFAGNYPAHSWTNAPEQVTTNWLDRAGAQLSVPAPTPGAAGGTPVTSGGTSVEALRADAMAAIQLGRDPAAVRARFQKLTGQTL